MGNDYNCGCRESMNRWKLCERHEKYIIEEDISTLKIVMKEINTILKPSKNHIRKHKK